MSLEMVSVSTEEFARLRRKLPAITSDNLMRFYGISENTWRKLRDGRPVKRGTLDRLMARYERLCSSGE